MRGSSVRNLFIDDGPGDSRAGIFEDGALVELYLEQPADTQYWVGYAYSARIISKHSGFAIVALEDDQAILRPLPAAPEGASLKVQITRLAIPEPGRWKLMQVKPATDTARYRNGHEAWVQAQNIAHYRTATPDEAEYLQEALNLALAGQLAYPGGSISWERTRAGLVFDVDGEGEPRAVNLAAAMEIARLLRLFQVGGAALIDFINLDSKAARTELAEAFDAASARDPRACERTAINGYGLMQVVRPKHWPSVLDTLLGTRRASACDDALAARLLRAAAAAQGAGERTLVTRPALAAELAKPKWQPALDKLIAAIGAPIRIVSDPQATGYGHVHVRPI